MSEPVATIEIAESLECDGCSIKVKDSQGRILPVIRVGQRRQWRTMYVTWQVVDDPAQ